MFRRDFIQRATIVGASGLATLANGDAAEKVTVTYKIKGFSCFTCAVGLEVLLQKQHGVVRAKASYPDATVVIGFDPALINEEALRMFISGTGFSVLAREK